MPAMSEPSRKSRKVDIGNKLLKRVVENFETTVLFPARSICPFLVNPVELVGVGKPVFGN